MSQVMILRSNKQRDSLTLAQESFLSAKRSEGISPHTERSYTHHLRKFADWIREQGVEDIQQITPAHVRLYFTVLQNEYTSNWSVHDHCRVVRTFLKFCFMDELISKDIMARVKLPKLDKKILPALSKEDVQKLISACATERDRALILVLVDSGLRCAECANLIMGDFDAKTGQLFVRAGKGNKDRVSFVGNKAKRVLLKYLLSRGKLDDNAPLFASLRDTTQPIAANGIQCAIVDIGKKAGVDASPHVLRRTFAIWSLRAGCDIFALQRLMGHSDLTILRGYLDLVQADLEKAHAQHGALDFMGV